MDDFSAHGKPPREEIASPLPLNSTTSLPLFAYDLRSEAKAKEKHTNYYVFSSRN